MEENKRIKRKKIIRTISQTISYVFLVLLILIALFLVTYVITSKIANKNGVNPPFGLYTIISPSMTPNIKVYDVVFTKKVDPNELKKGDVITFFSTNAFFGGTPITHRIVDIVEPISGERMFIVKGDANEKADDEKVLASNVVGKVKFKIPQLGRIQFFLASKGGWLIGIMIPALSIIAYDLYKIFRLLILRGKLLELENKHGNI